MGTPRDTVYPWGEGAHKQKSERYRPDNAISKVQCAPRTLGFSEPTKNPKNPSNSRRFKRKYNLIKILAF